MVALAYPGPTSVMRESVACYAFLEALDDPVLALKIREREPPSLEQAFQIALRLEAYANAGATGAPERNDKDRRGQCRAAQEVGDKKPDDRWVEVLKELRQQQVHMKQLLGEVRAAVSPTKIAPVQREAETEDREQEAADLPASRSGRPRRATVTCYGCGRQGHYRSQCPYTQDSRPAEVGSPWAMAANRHIKEQSGLYLRMKIGKKWCLALLDTGSEITLIPTS